MCSWFIVNRLSVSLEKTLYSIFHTRKKKVPDICNELVFNSTTIKREQCAKYLGVDVDEKLDWNTHVKTVCNKLIKLAGSFKIIRGHIPTKCKRQLYYAYVYSQILYGIEVYGHTSKSNINKIQVLQNRILKILHVKDWFTATNTLHSELCVLKIEDIFKLSLLQFVYKQRNNLLPNVFDNYFKSRQEIHSVNTRYSYKLEEVRARNKHGQSTVKYKGAKWFNQLPESICQCNTLSSFKKRTKSHLINQY